ncbi:glycerol-3-phosphate dehydrogenase [Albimonas pacifica]|uniref:Glycerol-3-phosphate dehydrogenase n=1 Tax=Albimonas pacifica TaxID=1114924 RepID=A0A1I3C374_9RHOB|nr:glycerol-3-phosphate dehydrogenase [Albimonas pacifica]SFH68900.1 homodimeric glycerol 3-phosphate dehydrogenase (quinone) [Albimonas pacifica]
MTDADTAHAPDAIPTYDLAVVGGGVNGAGIARDAAGRGLSVHLCEAGDLAQATSSASTKLFHGGLRYLEFYEFGLVRKALIERETLIRAMPHISWPLRFVLPHHPGLRPAWLLRIGLFIYDHLGGRKILPATKTLDLRKAEVGKPLKPEFTKGFEYSDGWVMDSRLVVLNARDAAARGAVIETRTRLVGGVREDKAWRLRLEGPDGAIREIRARAVVNAAGPWVDEVLRHRLGRNAPAHIRLVRGSHIVTKKLFDHDRAYIFQTSDGRIVFAIPYEDDFTLIGTTDRDHQGDPSEAVCTDEEADYLREVASQYLARPIEKDDVVWTYSGVRPLYDDGAKSATQATRDYVLQLEDEGGAPLLNVFGGKITTFRKLAEAALEKLKPSFPQMTGPWTHDAPMPGGDMPWDGVPALVAELRAAHPFLTARWATRLARMYGTEARKLLGDATQDTDLGARFGWDLTEAEVRFLMTHEWARTAEDVLFRRSRLGLRFSAEEIKALDAWMAAQTLAA